MSVEHLQLLWQSLQLKSAPAEYQAMHVILVSLRIKQECVCAFEAAIREHAEATRRLEVGCLRFDVAVDEDEPRTYHIYEVYADELALAEHARSPTKALLAARLPSWIEERRRIAARLHPAVNRDI